MNQQRESKGLRATFTYKHNFSISQYENELYCEKCFSMANIASVAKETFPKEMTSGLFSFLNLSWPFPKASKCRKKEFPTLIKFFALLHGWVT